MKTLYLLRHGKSDWTESQESDFRRPLNMRGRESAATVGRYIAQHHLPVAYALCSPATRTAETCAVMFAAAGLRCPVEERDDLYLASAAVMLDMIHDLPDTLDHVLIIGHNPGLQSLAMNLIGDAPAELRFQLGQKLPTGGFVELTVTGKHWHDFKAATARLARFARPRELMENTAGDDGL